ncbi:hypothetical protein [Nostoc sp. 'Peltigera malacea cyanobiont' DB3992]|uniref:hypothetical protein n=1 Tax=Nostoc sp. 'Peltigera malacea cyanobiont' DB3992 TaxID=1206980 RepID=UPI00211DD6A3|nr:hypothetical protein [Nostoc sp. 'Peltigera malacea cyanobiont' DB3992]
MPAVVIELAVPRRSCKLRGASVCDTLRERREVRAIRRRISRVYFDSLEETVKSLLQSLGKLNRPYLTAVEEKLLSLIEREYGLIDQSPQTHRQ